MFNKNTTLRIPSLMRKPMQKNGSGYMYITCTCKVPVNKEHLRNTFSIFWGMGGRC